VDLQLINVELSEAKLYRTSRNFGLYTGRQIADLMYLQTIMLYMQTLDNKTHSAAMDYAKRTGQFGAYTLFRTSATDLYMLGYAIKHSTSNNIELAEPVDSKKFLERLLFDDRRHTRFLRDLSGGRVSDSEATAYFYRLEKQLKITDSRFRMYRQRIVNYDNMTDKTRANLALRLQKELFRVGQGAVLPTDIMIMNRLLSASSKEKNIKAPKSAGPSTASRLGGAALGALAGRYAAGKLSKMDTKTAKNVGTGIGAVAGYWASGRKSK